MSELALWLVNQMTDEEKVRLFKDSQSYQQRIDELESENDAVKCTYVISSIKKIAELEKVIDSLSSGTYFINIGELLVKYALKITELEAEIAELEKWKRAALKAQPHLEKLMLVTEHFENKE